MHLFPQEIRSAVVLRERELLLLRRIVRQLALFALIVFLGQRLLPLQRPGALQRKRRLVFRNLRTLANVQARRRDPRALRAVRQRVLDRLN